MVPARLGKPLSRLVAKTSTPGTPLKQLVNEVVPLLFEGRTRPSSGHVSEQPVAIGQFHPAQALVQHFHYYTLNFDSVFAGHVKISVSDPVTRTVCSK